MRVPWWGIASSVLAPVILVGGWTVAADLQPMPFDAVSRSISALAAQGMPYRWVITSALLGVGICNFVTGLALRPAAEAGRILLILGGVCSMLIAAYPQHQHSGSPEHEAFSFVGVVLMTIWPIAATREDADTPLCLQRRVAFGAVALNLGLLVWFTAELFNGPLLGLAERLVTVDESLWPLFVVVSVIVAGAGAAQPEELEAAVRSR
ncbi:MAG TPA: DUF998 domain-containing protein [Streptosporangiaceae bacterium]|nr:DUF998 domain-containing protein [Streptosporangiaceae bacterium]